MADSKETIDSQDNIEKQDSDDLEFVTLSDSDELESQDADEDSPKEDSETDAENTPETDAETDLKVDQPPEEAEEEKPASKKKLILLGSGILFIALAIAAVYIFVLEKGEKKITELIKGSSPPGYKVPPIPRKVELEKTFDAVKSITLTTSGKFPGITPTTSEDIISVESDKAAIQVKVIDVSKPSYPTGVRLGETSATYTVAEESTELTQMAGVSTTSLTSVEKQSLTAEAGQLTDVATAKTQDVTPTEKEQKQITSTKQLADAKKSKKPGKVQIFKSKISIIKLNPELTLTFEPFVILSPKDMEWSYISLALALKTSNERVYKEIQKKKITFRGEIYKILNRIYQQSNSPDLYSLEELKRKILDNLNEILVHGRVEKLYLTDFLKA